MIISIECVLFNYQFCILLCFFSILLLIIYINMVRNIDLQIIVIIIVITCFIVFCLACFGAVYFTTAVLFLIVNASQVHIGNAITFDIIVYNYCYHYCHHSDNFILHLSPFLLSYLHSVSHNPSPCLPTTPSPFSIHPVSHPPPSP